MLPALSGETGNGNNTQVFAGLTVTTHWQHHHHLSGGLSAACKSPNNASDSFLLP
jgi:hypothetical protein